MKRFLIPSIFIPIAMICSCQKQDSVEQQLAQQKAEMDVREKALDEKVSALDEKVNVLDGRVKALAEQEKAAANSRMAPANADTQVPDPAQVQAERQRAIQQFSAEIRARMANDSKMKNDRTREIQQRLEQPQGQKQRKLDMINGAVLPAPAATLPVPSPVDESTSPASSSTPQ